MSILGLCNLQPAQCGRWSLLSAVASRLTLSQEEREKVEQDLRLEMGVDCMERAVKSKHENREL
jgi:hypothetical protein